MGSNPARLREIWKAPPQSDNFIPKLLSHIDPSEVRVSQHHARQHGFANTGSTVALTSTQIKAVSIGVEATLTNGFLGSETHVGCAEVWAAPDFPDTSICYTAAPCSSSVSVR